MGKVTTISGLKKELIPLRKKSKKIVFTNGCFDIMHPGHIKVLQKAKSYGNILIVGLNSDASIKRIKGSGRPIMDQKARATVLAALEIVDFVVIFKEDTPLNLIKKISPDYLVKGGDWEKGRIIGGDFVNKVFRVKLVPEYSTTNIIEKIKKL